MIWGAASIERTRDMPESRPENADVIAARSVFAAAVTGLTDTAAALDVSFVRALDVLQQLSGRLIVSGMGKSGHIGAKIAATLASTGTPAFFVHPAEAAHGDLGMITAADAVLCLSYSGETAELSALIAYTRRFSIPLLAIAAQAESTLSRAADITLLLPPLREACEAVPAPTVSSAAMLVLGDALAVALMRRRGFGPEDFRLFHPGGKLGSRLLRVADLMHTGDALPVVAADTPMREAIITITAKSLGCTGVLREGTLIGIITDGDLRRHMGDPQLTARPAVQIMNAHPVTVGVELTAAAALALMQKHKISGLFVVEGARPVGFLHLHDCLRAGVA